MLALVSSQLNTNFQQFRPTLGDMPKLMDNYYTGYFLLLWLQAMVLWQKLWPTLKFWHWSLCCWEPISYDIDKNIWLQFIIVLHKHPKSWSFNNKKGAKIEFMLSTPTMMTHGRWLIVIRLLAQSQGQGQGLDFAPTDFVPANNGPIAVASAVLFNWHFNLKRDI